MQILNTLTHISAFILIIAVIVNIIVCGFRLLTGTPHKAQLKSVIALTVQGLIALTIYYVYML